jgi:hypothetical protein
MLVIDPRFLDVIRWTAETGAQLASYGTIGRLLNPDGWREWGQGVVSIPAVQALNPPEPSRYPVWSDWALALNQTLVHLA